MQIMISLDSDAYTRKPEKGQIGKISSRIAFHRIIRSSRSDWEWWAYVLSGNFSRWYEKIRDIYEPTGFCAGF